MLRLKLFPMTPDFTLREICDFLVFLIRAYFEMVKKKIHSIISSLYNNLVQSSLLKSISLLENETM